MLRLRFLTANNALNNANAGNGLDMPQRYATSPLNALNLVINI